jgi:ribonuclease P protein component
VVHVCERREREAGTPLGGGVGALAVAQEPGGCRARLGLVVPGAVGTAVERNRLKRQIRAAWRELLPRTAPVDCVVVVRKRAVGIAFAELAGHLESCLRSLNVLIAPSAASVRAADGAV